MSGQSEQNGISITGKVNLKMLHVVFRNSECNEGFFWRTLTPVTQCVSQDFLVRLKIHTAHEYLIKYLKLSVWYLAVVISKRRRKCVRTGQVHDSHHYRLSSVPKNE